MCYTASEIVLNSTTMSFDEQERALTVVLLNFQFLCTCVFTVIVTTWLLTRLIAVFSYRVSYAGDNFVRYTGATISMAQTQCKYYVCHPYAFCNRAICRIYFK